MLRHGQRRSQRQPISLWGTSTLSDAPSRTTRQQSPATPETRERLSAIAKARWADPIASAKLRAAIRSPANRAKVGEASKARWDDPAAREKLIAGIRASQADPIYREKKASVTRERWADPATRARIVEGMQGKPKRRRNRDISDS